MSGSFVSRKSVWQNPLIALIGILISVTLWGSAFPAVKTAYAWFGIQSDSTTAIPQLLTLAGSRFLLAGLLVLIFSAIQEKRWLWPHQAHLSDICLLAFVQTVLQYATFFIGLSHIRGATGSILSSMSAFFAIILAAVFLKTERMTACKYLGCGLGILAVILLNVKSGSLDWHFSWQGEGLMLVSSLTSAVAQVISKPMAQRTNPKWLCGWQFVIGGMCLTVVGFGLGGRLYPQTHGAILLLLYLGFLSAVAFTLWTILVKYHEVGHMSIFKGLIPVVGTLGSALILKETIHVFHYALALLLMLLGIVLIHLKPKGR